MSSALNILSHLKTLCQEEIAKKNSENLLSETKLRVPLPHPSLSDSDNFLAGNRSRSKENISDTHQKKSEECTPEANNSENPNIRKRNCYKCAKCSFTTELHSTYLKHTTICKPSAHPQCPVCSQEFTIDNLDEHVKSVHLTPDVYKQQKDGSHLCIKCNVKHTYFSKFKLHLQSLTHKDLTRCRSCGVVLLSEELNEHCIKVHSRNLGSGLFTCKVCGVGYPFKSSVDRHVASAHQTKELFKCEQCNASFQRLDNLKKHQVSHMQVRDFPCCFCKLTFKNKDALKNHINCIHFQSRFQCEICYRSFPTEFDLSNHVLTHVEGHKFYCMVCGKPFTTYGKRERHFQTHLKANTKQRKVKQVDVNDDSTRRKRCSQSTLLNDSKNSLLSPLCQNSLAGSNVSSDMPTDSFPEKKTVRHTQTACSVSNKRKRDVGENCENECPTTHDQKATKKRKNAVSKKSTKETSTKCDDVCPSNVDKSGDEMSGIVSPEFLLPCSIIPDKSVFVDMNTITGVDSDIESLSSLRPDTSVTEGALMIDFDYVCELDDVEIIDLACVDPLNIQLCKVDPDSLEANVKLETDSVSNYILLEPCKVETDSGISVCNDVSQDGLTVEKAPAKKRPTKRSKRNSKSVKYPEPEMRVVMRNVSCDDDMFVLPEFVVEDDDD